MTSKPSTNPLPPLHLHTTQPRNCYNARKQNPGRVRKANGTDLEGAGLESAFGVDVNVGIGVRWVLVEGERGGAAAHVPRFWPHFLPTRKTRNHRSSGPKFFMKGYMS